MRGKSVDTEFVSSFIQECASINKLSPEDVCEEALRKIEEIDKQLKLRLKLVDVLSFFNYKKKPTIIERQEISFDSIAKEPAAEIFGIIANAGHLNTEDMMSRFATYQDPYRKDLIFTLKQLLEAKVIFRNSSGVLAHGPNFKLFNEAKIYQK